MLKILLWITPWNMNPETPLGKYLDKNHHQCALIQLVPHETLIGKIWENSQKKTISLPPYLCKQVEVWIHNKSIIVLSYHSASKHLMESHQNKFWWLEGRSKHFHSHSSLLSNLSTQRLPKQLKVSYHNRPETQENFKRTMCVNRPALCIGIHLLPKIIGNLQLSFPRDPMQWRSTFKGINHIEPSCVSCNVGFIIEGNQCCTHQGHDCTIHISLPPKFAKAILTQVEAAG